MGYCAAHIGADGAMCESECAMARRCSGIRADGWASVYDRGALRAGQTVTGPALIEEYASTTVVHPGDGVTVDAYGDLVIDILRS